MDEATSHMPLNRREFLNLAWLASLGILLVDVGGVTYLFVLPRFREGEFGGQFLLRRAGETLPIPGTGPFNFAYGRFWLVQKADNQVLALTKFAPTSAACMAGSIAAEFSVVPAMEAGSSSMALISRVLPLEA